MSDENLEERLRRIEERLANLTKVNEKIVKIGEEIDEVYNYIMKDNLTPHERRVLSGLKRLGEFTANQVKALYGMSDAGAYVLITSLMKKGYVERIEPEPGQGRDERYKVKIIDE